MTNDEYTWTDNPTVSGVSVCNTDVLNDCLMHLKYDHKGNGSGLNLFDVIEKDHILSTEESKGFAPLGTYVYKEPASSNRYGYPDFYAKCMEEKADGLEVELQLEENTITVYKNMNGHIFYNIADKDVVDLYYIHTGACWMYGIDEENERIFLPRNDWFTMSGKPDEVGEFVEAGLPNIKDNGSITIHGLNSSTVYNDSGNYVGYVWSNSNAQGKYASFDASNSSEVYGKSDTVQPAAIKKLLYMVVGNTEVTSSITNVTEITTSENDTIPLFTAQYFDFTPNNPSWLKAGTQQNSGGIYTTAYNTLVNCLTDNIYNIKVVDTANMTSGVDYSEFWKVDQLNMTFTTPTSGIIAEESTTAQLYFKVANAVQNLELLNVGEVLEALTLKTDKVQAAAASMPSNKYIDLTLGASGTTYTAPANGWFYLGINTTSQNDGILMQVSAVYGMNGTALSFEGWKQCTIPVRKGEPCYITYQRSGTDYGTLFRFIYAEGEV